MSPMTTQELFLVISYQERPYMEQTRVDNRMQPAVNLLRMSLTEKPEDFRAYLEAVRELRQRRKIN